MKIKKVLLAAALFPVVGGLLISIGCGSSDSESDDTQSDTQSDNGTQSEALELDRDRAIGTPAAADDEGLVGTWNITAIMGNPPPAAMSYTFNDDGALAFTQRVSEDDDPIVIPGTYTLVDGTLSILLEGTDDAMTGTVTINGDTLTFKGTGNARGQTTTMQRAD